MLAAFLDALGIAHDQGVIAEGADLTPPDPARLSAAARTLFETFPEDEVTLYLRVLMAMDEEMWGGLAETLRGR